MDLLIILKTCRTSHVKKKTVLSCIYKCINVYSNHLPFEKMTFPPQKMKLCQHAGTKVWNQKLSGCFQLSEFMFFINEKAQPTTQKTFFSHHKLITYSRDKALGPLTILIHCMPGEGRTHLNRNEFSNFNWQLHLKQVKSEFLR